MTLHRLNHLSVSSGPISPNPLLEYLFKSRPADKPLALRNLRNILVPSEVIDKPLNKRNSSQDRLPLHFTPDLFLPYPPLNKLPIFLLGLPSVPTELPK